MRKRIQSFAHAFRGIFDFIRLGANAKIQLAASITVTATGWYLDFTHYQWLAVILCIGCVLAAEAINTAIEELANEVTAERKESIRRVKDIAAGAVLILSIASLAVFLIILFERIANR